MTDFVYASSFAAEMDAADPLARYREQYHIPVIHGKQALYFTGNSLGLQPKAARAVVEQELDDWAQWGVEGHFHAKHPWFSYHELFTEGAAQLVGARPEEVVLMNGLTVNVHLMLVSFYRPNGKRTKIICEAKAFPSDQYALESQVKFHGLDPKTDIVEVAPREGEHTIRHEDIEAAIDANADEVALVFLGGVNYYTGQRFDLERITRKAHSVGAVCGFDLAHAAGNVPLELHDWGVDFACWCTYKYLNSGPGSVSGVFVHERHANAPDLPRFAGWWGYDKTSRFQMEQGFKPIPGAEGWQLSNAPVFAMAPHKAALDLFTEVGMDALRAKAIQLTAYLEFVVEEAGRRAGSPVEIITPRNPEERGCQLSLLVHGHGRPLFDRLLADSVIADWREPNVIRMAPVPMYNTFTDVYTFGTLLEAALKNA